MKNLLLLLLCFVSLIVNSQKKDPKIPKKIQRSIPLLTDYLTSQKSNERDKVDAIYTWITNNIEYNYKLIQSDEYSTGIDPVEILKSKSTICTGYVELMKAMLDQIGIKNETISGYIHNMHWIPGKLAVKEEHSWIVIHIEGEWFLADPTWDAGYIGRIPTNLAPYKAKTFKKTEFKSEKREKRVVERRVKNEISRKKKYDEKPLYKDEIGFVRSAKKEFFLIESDTFLLTHLPIVPMWQLRDNFISIENFALPTDSLKMLLEDKARNIQDFEVKVTEYSSKNFIDQLILTGDEGADFNKYNPSLKALFYYNYMVLINNKNLQKLARGSEYEIEPTKYGELNAKTDTIIKYTKLFKENEKIYYKQDKDYDKSHNKLSVEKDKTISKLIGKIEKCNEKIVTDLERDNDKIKENLLKISELETKIATNYPKAINYSEPKDLQKLAIKSWIDSVSNEIEALNMIKNNLDSLRMNSKFNNVISNADFISYLFLQNGNYIPFNSYSTTEVTDEIDSLIAVTASNSIMLFADSIPLEMLPKEVMLKLKKIENLTSKANANMKILTEENKMTNPFKHEIYFQAKLIEAVQIAKEINMKTESFNSAVDQGLKKYLNDFSSVQTFLKDQGKLKLKKFEYIQEETEKEHLRDSNLIKDMNSSTKKWKSKFKI